MEHNRSTDRDNVPFIRVNREVPLWSIVSGLIVVIGQAAALYYGQARLSEVMVVQAATIKDLGVQINQLSVDIAKSNLKTVEYDFRIGDLDRRLHQVESTQQNILQIPRKER